MCLKALLFGAALLGVASCRGGSAAMDAGVIAASGSTFVEPEQVTAGNESNFAPDLSPDGVMVVYTSDREGNKDLWEKKASGGFARPLTTHSADDFYAVASPDGDQLAFVSRREDAAGDIHVMDWERSTFGGGEKDVVAISSNLTEDAWPAWFPDGKKLVFAARTPGSKVPVLMTADLNDLKPVSLAELRGDQPNVSPDGKRIVFVRDGALFLFQLDGEISTQLTPGGALQDGRPRFTADGNGLVFIRYADDTNRDGKLDGDDRPTVWQLDLATHKAEKNRENYALTPLTAAVYAAYSPQLRAPWLYVALQTGDGLDIFRLPAGGQGAPAADLDELRRQIDQHADHDRKVFVMRRAQAGFHARKEDDFAAEVALMELEWIVQGSRTAEAAWVAAKLKDNFPKRKDIIALAELELVTLELAPLAYPEYSDDLTREQQKTLESLLARAESAATKFSGDEAAKKRVAGRAALTKARVLAAQRKFFDANKLLADTLEAYGDDRRLSARVAYYAALITPATSDADTAIVKLRETAQKYPEDRNTARQASEAAVKLLEGRQDRLEALVALRTESRKAPIMPALAHMRIADIYAAAGKQAVAANELRQIVDLYPESPEVVLEAAGRLSLLEEKEGRFEAAEAMLRRLGKTLAEARPEHQVVAKRLLIDAILRRGEALLKEGDAVVAIKEYKKVVELEPLEISAHRGMIDSRVRQGKLDDALDEYEEAMYEANENPKATAAERAARAYFYGYALTFRIDEADSARVRLNRIDDAIKVLETARASDARLLYVHQTLGWLYLQKGFWRRQYYDSGAVWAKVRQKTGMVLDFVGAGDPDFLEIAIDSFQTAYFLSKPDSFERAGLAQNLGQTYFELNAFQKSLSYYMQRVKMLDVIPMRDPRAEGVLLRRAGRAAFQTEELELAESLQRNALTAWEGVADDAEIAYSLDALALTLRERGKPKEAIELYVRLQRVHERLGQRGNLVGTLSNLGFCFYLDGQYDTALERFAEAETVLESLRTSDDGESVGPAASSAIQVDLGGQASAAKGFSLFARHNMIVTFRGKIYERLGRQDLAIEAYERKLALLKEERERLIDDEDRSDAALAEELAVHQNNLAALYLAAGRHQRARELYVAAAASAKYLRPDGQTYLSPGELVNTINEARVVLRLATLGVVPQADAKAKAAALEAAAADLKPVFEQGAKAEGRPLSQLLALASSLRAVSGEATAGPVLRKNFEESLAVAAKVDAPRDGILLAYSGVGGGQSADAPLAGAVTQFKTQALANPALEWKMYAESDPARAFEALDRYVYGGGTLKSPPDRALARSVIDALLASEADEARAGLLLRRYMLLRLADMSLRAAPEKTKAEDGSEKLAMPRAVQKLLALREPAQLAASLGDGDTMLVAHYALATAKAPAANGRLYLLAIRKAGSTLASVSLPGAAVQKPGELAKAIASAGGIKAALPEKGGRLYVVPDGELWDAPWEQVVVDGEALATRNILAFLPSPDMMPELVANRRLPKASVGHLAWPPVVPPKPPAADPEVIPTEPGDAPEAAPAKETATEAERNPEPTAPPPPLQVANAMRDYAPIVVDGVGSVGPKLAAYDLVHIDAPVLLNDVEPGSSVVMAAADRGAGAHVADAPLRALIPLDLTQTTAVVMTNVRRDNPDLLTTSEGHDGWAFLALSTAAAGVSTVVAIDKSAVGTDAAAWAAPASTPREGESDPKAAAAEKAAQAVWTKFYAELASKSAGEAAHAAKLPGRIIGYVGIPGVEEKAWAEAHFDEAVEEAEEAYDEDQDFGAAAKAYKRALAFAQLLGKKDEEDEYLDKIVKALFQKRDYVGALHFKLKIAAKLKPLPKTDPKAKDDDRDPVDYGTALVDAAVLAVRGQQYGDAAALLAEAEAIFKDEEDDAQLGKILQYRGINFENQKRYAETIKSYEASRQHYAEVNPEQATYRLLDIGNVYRNNFSNYPKALEYYESAAREFKQQGKQEAYVPVLIDKANTMMAIGQLEDAISLLEREVVPTIDRDTQRVLWVRASQTLANAYLRAGLYQEAQDLNERVLAAADKIEDKRARAERTIEAIGLRGFILAKLGQYKAGFKDFKDAIALAREFNIKYQQSLLYNNYGFWAREFGAIDQSIEFLTIATRIDEELKSKSSIAYDQRNMGLSIILKGDYNRARDLLTEALKTSEALNLTYNTAYCYFGLGDVALREKKWPEAEKHFKKALALSISGYMQDFTWRAHGGVAQALLGQGKTKEAESSLTAAVTLVESLRAGLKSEESRNAFQSDAGVQEVYEAYAVTLMRLKKVEEAWRVSERARSRAFIDSLGTQKLRFAKQDSNALLEEEKEKRSAVEGAERRLGQATAAEKAARTAELATAKSEHAALLAKLKAADAQLTAFVQVEAIAPGELQTLLPPDAALVQYLTAKDALLVWVVKDGKVTGHEVALAREELTARVRDFRLLLQSYSTTDYLGRELADALLEPITGDLSAAGAKRLVVVPHGPLHFFPFAALPYGDEEGSYLMDGFAVSYLESATVARFTFAPRSGDAKTEKGKVLALVNPAVPELGDSATLPFAAKEADVIPRYFPATTAKEGGDASESAMREGAESYDVLHVASHGDFRPLTPGDSRLMLSPGDGNDGALTVNEVFGLDVRADMVTLSACDSGLGKLSPADEIIGLNRAFMYAGAETVVSSLWRISDVASAVTMKRFYRYLAEGQDKAEAMRQAQAVVRKYFKHPAYWSSFKVSGRIL
jgi:CHAT domain-containing protein/tetratricopeptide (TPR) repeat protein/Tol biopolymer transport system component